MTASHFVCTKITLRFLEPWDDILLKGKVQKSFPDTINGQLRYGGNVLSFRQLLYNATSDSNTAETRVMERLLRNAHTYDKDRFAPEYIYIYIYTTSLPKLRRILKFRIRPVEFLSPVPLPRGRGGGSAQKMAVVGTELCRT